MSKIVCSGALIYALNTHRFLFVHRAGARYSKTWGLVGGKNERQETPWQGLTREIYEEIGETHIIKTIPLETFMSNNEFFLFHTYLCIVPTEFIPSLNDEHDGYSWVSFGAWPNPLHPGVQVTLNKSYNIDKLKTVIEVLELLGRG